jgi:hypothetical protein
MSMSDETPGKRFSFGGFMRFSTLTLTALLLAGGAASAVVASDDLTIVTKHTHDGKPAGTSTSYLASDHVRMAREDGHETIVDLKTGVMTTLDGKKKTYYTVTKQDMEQMAVKMQERMNTPEMKKAMEAMQSMSGGMSTSFDVKKTGATRKVAGYGCEEWAITMGTLSTIKECVTSELQYPAHAWDTYKEFSESMKNMTSAFGPMAKSGAELAEKLKAMKGFPVATTTAVDVMGHKTTIESEVIEVRKGSIPASAWEIPAGYTKIENPMLKAFEGHGRPHR